MPSTDRPASLASKAATPCPQCRAEKPASTRYCAPAGCYCGHPECPAFPSYIPRRALSSVALLRGADERMAKSWSDREEPTWLDR